MPNHTVTTYEKRLKAEEAEQERCRRIAEMVFAMLDATGIPHKLESQAHTLYSMVPRIIMHGQPFDPVHPVEHKNNVIFLPDCLAGKRSVLEGDDEYPFTDDVYFISVDYEIFRAVLDEKLQFLSEHVSDEFDIRNDAGEPVNTADIEDLINRILDPGNYSNQTRIDATGGLMS